MSEQPTAPAVPAEPAAAPVEPAAPATPAEPTAVEAPTGPGKVEDLPDWAQRIIGDARREAAESRVKAKTAAEELAHKIGRELGLVKDDERPDPAALTEQITTTQAQARQANLELAIYKAASTAGADANALLDSRAFLNKVADIDPTDTTALAAAIGEATTSNPRLKATPAAASVGGAEIAGGTGPTRTYTRAQLADPAFFAAHRADILRAQAEGRIKE